MVLRLDDGDVARMVGQTLFWADRYLVDDRIAALHARGVQDPATYRSPVADLLRLRPLIDSGIVVPVYAELAVALTAQTIDVAVRADLATAEYVDWVKQQIVIEGPTAREAAFVHVVDDYPHDDWFYLINRVQPGGDRTHEGADLHGRLLGPLRPRPQLRAVAGDGSSPSDGTTHQDQLSVLDAVTPAGLATGSVLIGGTMGPVLLAGAGLAGLAAAVPPTRARLDARGKAGYAFWLARPRRRV